MGKKRLGHEFYVFLAIVSLSLIIQARSGQFFTLNNIVDLMVSFIVPAIFAMCELIVIISGGMDVSFPAVASLSMFATTKILLSMDYTGNVFFAFLLSGSFGLIMGAINGALISIFNLPALIVTLGTQSIFMGILQGALNAQEIAEIPKVMFDFGNAKLFVAINPLNGLKSNMSSSILILFAVVIITYVFLHFTMWGRGVYAIGGDSNSAIRAGFKVKQIKFSIYCFVGIVAGIAGMTRVCMMQNCQPNNLIGMEMTVIAAVVLGGTSVKGGSGTIIGALLGTFLLTIISNSLLLLSIPTYWQSFFTGLIIIIGTGVTSFQLILSSHRLPSMRKSKNEA